MNISKKYIVYSILLIIATIVFILICYYSNTNNKITESTISRPKTIVDYSKYIDNEDIYCSTRLSPNAIIDLTSINELYDNSDFVAIGKITDKNLSFLPEGQDFAITSGKMEVSKVIKGENTEKEITFFINGGFCTLEEYSKLLIGKSSQLEKLGILELSEKDKEEKYIVFNYDYGKDFLVDSRYLIVAEKNDYGYYVLSSYGFLDIPDNLEINTKQDILKIV